MEVLRPWANPQFPHLPSENKNTCLWNFPGGSLVKAPCFHYRGHGFCKTQNSGLRSKEEKPRDPINQPSRCNTQEGLLSVAQTGDFDLLGGRAHRTANWASFLYAKKPHTISILHMGYKVISYTFAKQSYWYKLRGLHVYKVILLAQTSRAFVQT